MTPLLIPNLAVEPLRYFFSKYPGQDDRYLWDPDEKKRKVDIDHAYQFYRVALQEKPRIIVTRGAIATDRVGLTDNLAEQKSFHETRGLKDRVNLTFYSGVMSVITEARQRGTCEVVADMAMHFLLWSRPEICSTFNLKNFGLPMQVSDCEYMHGEDDDKFQCTISIPWMMEEKWRVRDDGIGLKDVLLDLKASL